MDKKQGGDWVVPENNIEALKATITELRAEYANVMNRLVSLERENKKMKELSDYYKQAHYNKSRLLAFYQATVNDLVLQQEPRECSECGNPI